MELQFEKTALEHLRRVVSEVRNEEQTQELKLNDSMPDVGKVLGSWGQVLIRSKEWRSGGISVSGGVMAWVLYAPEDGSDPRSVETWIPFQLRWDLPEGVQDGQILLHALLGSMDARVLSARKLMLRASVSVLCQASVQELAQLFTPSQVPEDVQLLTGNYPICMAVEAGEKVFSLDEELSGPVVEKIIRYQLQPELVDRKIVEDKVVFRGEGLLHLLYRDSEGRLNTWDARIPFSQYADLHREYGDDAAARVVCVITGLELEKEDDRLRLKADLSGQYEVYDRTMVQLVEDAYSLRRKVIPKLSTLEVPQVLDRCSRTVRMEHDLQLPLSQAVDTAMYVRCPGIFGRNEESELETQAQWQTVGYDVQGTVQGGSGRSENRERMACSVDGKIDALLFPSGWPRAENTIEGTAVQADLYMDVLVTASQGLDMVSGLELGELEAPDPNRPSLVLRRAGERQLWDLAKAAGSTVDAIRAANGLDGEPAPDRLLLIPIS